MLRQRVHADNYVWAPTLKDFNHVADAALMKKLSRLRTKAVHRPIDILHPGLPVSEYPIVDTNHLGGDGMRLFYGTNNANCIRLTLKKLVHAGHNRSGRRAMPAAGVGRDDQNFWSPLRHFFLRFEISNFRSQNILYAPTAIPS